MQSNIEGLGLLQIQNCCWNYDWTYREHFDRKFFNMPGIQLPKSLLLNMVTNLWVIQILIIYLFDNMRFINHSTNPNVISLGTDLVAGRDINFGEELIYEYTLKLFDRRSR